MANYKKIYNDNIIDYYKYQIDKLEKENKELKEQANQNISNKKLKEVKRILNSAKYKYKSSETNWAIERAINIIEGEQDV